MTDSAAAPARPEATPAAGRTQNELPSGTNITQIREILFGQTQRENEGRFRRVEENISRLRDELMERLDLMHAQIDREIQAAKSESTQMGLQFAERVKALEDHLRGEVKSNAKFLQGNLDAMRLDLENAVRGLSNSKTGRNDLADYLIEVGLRLKGEPTLNALDEQLKALVAPADPAAGSGNGKR